MWNEEMTTRKGHIPAIQVGKSSMCLDFYLKLYNMRVFFFFGLNYDLKIFFFKKNKHFINMSRLLGDTNALFK